MKEIKIERTEQWEYTAYGYGFEATGTSDQSAENHLLRKVVTDLEHKLGVIEMVAKDPKFRRRMTHKQQCDFLDKIINHISGKTDLLT